MMAALGIIMTAIGIIDASFVLASAGGGDSFAGGGVQLWQVLMRLRRKPDRIDLRRMRRQRGGGSIGCRILSAPFRGISHRRIVVRRMQRRAILSGQRVRLGCR